MIPSQGPSVVLNTDNMNDDLSKEHRLTNQFFKKSKIYNKKSFNSYNSKEFLLENINNEINSLYSLYRKNKYKKILPFTIWIKNNLTINKINLIFKKMTIKLNHWLLVLKITSIIFYNQTKI